MGLKINFKNTELTISDDSQEFGGYNIRNDFNYLGFKIHVHGTPNL